MKERQSWDWAMRRLMGISALKWGFFPQAVEKGKNLRRIGIEVTENIFKGKKYYE
jgi:hypothetical protein